PSRRPHCCDRSRNHRRHRHARRADEPPRPLPQAARDAVCRPRDCACKRTRLRIHLEFPIVPIRSMTAFAQAKGDATDDTPAFELSLKSVNHRFLDLHMRMPGETDALELKLRKLLKEKLHRGHVELTLAVDRTAASGFALNKELIGGYIQAFREAEREFAIA